MEDEDLLGKLFNSVGNTVEDLFDDYKPKQRNEPDPVPAGEPISGRPDKTKNIFSFLIPDEQTSGTGKNTKTYEELAHYYKGDQEYPYKQLQKSRYKPTQASNPNAEYIAINSDNFRNRIKEVFNNAEKIPSARRISDDEVNVRYTQGLDALGRFNIHRGSDERGQYLSYYDKWDVNMVADQIGKPFEVYDRIYLNQQRPSNQTMRNVNSLFQGTGNYVQDLIQR